MHLDDIKSALSTKLSLDIPPGKVASVLVVIFGQEPRILMTKKSEFLKVHAGEISFPGGKYEPKDSDVLETALRETWEEINLSIQRDHVVGQLHNVSTLNSGFTIMPFVAIVNRLPRLKGNIEVESTLHIPLYDLLQSMSDDKDPSHQSIKEMYTFTFQNHLIWGASARILKQISDILSKNNLM
jgi:8-oxo-dGTP pyrophosphatase MutT (NUDIX family)